jgi:hypothetical protein
VATNYAIFHDDGTFVLSNPTAGEAIGVWEQTGDLSFAVVSVFQDTDAAEAYGPGSATFTTTVALDASGDSYTTEGTIDVRAPDGTQIVVVP